MDRLQNTDLSATPPAATTGTTGHPRVSVPGGVAASAMHPYYLYMLIEEMRNYLVARGVTPSFTTLTQVSDAIHAHFSTAASDTVAGIVELATIAEVNTGTSTTLAVTPAGLSAVANDYQSFTASGTWTKPAWADGDELVIVEIWGGGGAGGANATGGGGGGGAYNRLIGKTSQLGATETVTIGAGGTTGGAGGNSSFGSIILAYGGGGCGSGAGAGGGGGGGTLTAGTTNSGSSLSGQAGGTGYAGPARVGSLDGAFDCGGWGGPGGGDGGSSAYGGGGGGGNAAGGNSRHGGAGGGATGGVSLYGGAGGAANTAGTAPGGGGGNGTGGAGARGECRVLVMRH